MIIKTFIAPNLEKALWLLNEELGPAAVILRTRLFNGSNVNQTKYIEIMAALDSSLLGKNIENQNSTTANPPNQIFNQFDREFENGYQENLDVRPEILEVIGW
jgi:flagellar biosynthesis GTPase FlhF